MTDYSFDEIREGARLSHSYEITAAVHEALVSVFGDDNPLHVEDDYAKSAGFAGRVMHGAIFHGFVSHFVGTRFPGKRSLLLSSSLNFHQPSYLNDNVELQATVKQKIETAKVAVLDIVFVNASSNTRVVSGRVQVAIRDE